MIQHGISAFYFNIAFLLYNLLNNEDLFKFDKLFQQFCIFVANWLTATKFFDLVIHFIFYFFLFFFLIFCTKSDCQMSETPSNS